jgi:hypothetical protein
MAFIFGLNVVEDCCAGSLGSERLSGEKKNGGGLEN